MTSRGADERVAGVDGCPGGWLVVLRTVADASQARTVLAATFAEVLALVEGCAVTAVDMPIGLPARGGLAGRRADTEARARLGARQSSVFAVPSRAAVYAPDYASACATALATSDPPRMVSKQCFHLFPKIREIDALLTPAHQGDLLCVGLAGGDAQGRARVGLVGGDAQAKTRVLECHPELSFWALNGERPLDEPKKVKSRPHPAGLALRRRLLVDAGYAAGFVADRGPFRAADVGPDDLLDACACAASAVRIVRGIARRFSADPSLDPRGLRMEIWG